MNGETGDGEEKLPDLAIGQCLLIQIQIETVLVIERGKTFRFVMKRQNEPRVSCNVYAYV